MYTYTDMMTTKTISILDDVYGRLKAFKRHDESFSDELRRLTETKGSVMEFSGVWKDMTDKAAEEMKKAIEKTRKGTRMREILERVEG